MKDIIISVDSTSHKVNFPDEFLGIGYENLQGNLIFQFDNNFIGGQARLDISIDCESGMIPNLTPYENGYILPIKSSLLTGSNVLMQLVIDETSLTQYSLTTDTEINPNKTYYEKVGNDYIIVENPVVGDISQYYEANTPVFKTDIFQLKVKDSINAQETIPEQYPTWINTLNTLIGTINQKLGLVDTALTEMNNLNINVSDKVDGEVTITFTDKQGNQKEVKINDGRGIVSILKTATSGNIDTYTITYTDNTTSTFEVTNGIDGTDGRGIVSIEKIETTGLVDTYTITYTDNTTSIFNVANGRGITNIEKISTNLLVDTYRISFNDGTTQNYEVTNGKGIVSIEKTSTEGLTDIYTITYNDETTATFNVVNGKGIVSIEKTSTSGYVDTYTITYNDGTTSTYEVTNGEVSQAQLDALQDELNYYKTIVNALPKITGSGTLITLNNTADSILSNILNPNMSQTTTTGKQLLNYSEFSNQQYITYDGEYMIITNNSGATIYPSITFTTPLEVGGYTARIEIENITSGKVCTLYVQDDINIYTSDHCIVQAMSTNTTYVANKTFTDTIKRFMLVVQDGTTIKLSVMLVKGIYTSENIGNWEQYTGEIPAPNTNFPMTIHTISGDNTLIENGSQLFDKDNADIVTGYIDGTTGNLIIGGTSKATREYIPIFPNTDMNISGFNNIVLAFYDKNKTFIERVLTASNSYTFNRNAYYIRIQGTGDTFNAETIMLNVGTTAEPYKPFVSQTAPLNLPVEQLFDKDNANVLNAYIPANGVITANSNDRTIWLSIKANTNYTIQLTQYALSGVQQEDDMQIGLFSSQPTLNLTGTRIFRDIRGSTLENKYFEYTFNSGNNTYVAIKVANIQKSDYDKTIATLQIEPGTKANSYTPFGTTPIEYCVIGNYADIFFKNVISSPLYNATLELDKWYLQKNINKIILDGTQNYQYSNAFGAIIYADSSVANVGVNEVAVMSNKAKGITINELSNQNGIAQNTTANRFLIKFDGVTNYNTNELIKQYFASNNYEVRYSLSTPEYIPLNDTLQSQLEYIYNQMLAYKGQTNISQINNDLPFIIDSTALKDLTSL